MKPYFAVLLVVFAITAVASSSRIQGENCTNGQEVIQFYMESRCPETRKVSRNIDRKQRRLMRQPSVENLRGYVTDVCRKLKPAVRTCFAEAVSDCDPVERQYLIGLSQNTGTICTPNGTDISPWMEHLLGRLTDDDVAHDRSCRRNRRRRRRDQECFEEATRRENFADFRSLRSYMDSATVRELAPVLQRIMLHFYGCVAEAFADDGNRCRNWRRNILAMMVFYSRDVPGLHLNYTTEEIDDMFEFPEADFDRRRWVGSFLNPLE
ncbi:uncharacterized protein LOC143276473 [Babylonia areolata]|uniref:uncharacterized protein LOC143276473 n=1 Tax=Babylonia areolata TaxID=304850 RepID=UPI003FCFA269